MGKKSIYLDILALVASLLVVLVNLPVFCHLGYPLFDLLQRINASSESSGVALVMLDQASLDEFARSDELYFPLPRQIFGAVAQVGKRMRAKAIAFDILFTEPSREGVEHDLEFAKLLKDSEVPVLFPAASKSGNIKNPIPAVQEVASGLGAVNIPSETGVYRKYFPKIDGQKTLAKQAAEFAGIDSVNNNSSEYYLEFYTKNGIPTVSLYNVIRAYRKILEGETVPKELEILSDKVWFVGYSAPGLHDLKATSVDPRASGTIVHATALANMSEGKGISKASIPLTILLTIIVSLVVISCIRFPNMPIPAVALSISALIALTHLLTFICWSKKIWLNPVPIFISSALFGAYAFAIRFQTAWKDRLKMAKSLQASMSPAMLELIRSGDVEVNRFGEEREISVLFSDLANFTSLSESVTASELVELLNIYLDEVVQEVVNHNGYVDKFIGDAVMSLWGAPIPSKFHAKDAVLAAIAYQEALFRFSEKTKSRVPGAIELYTRIGVHTGQAVVGNIGSASRYNYTAIGDVVNLASRLEGIGKQYGVRIVISESTIESISESITGVYELDTIRVKGKKEPTKIYSWLPERELSRMEIYASALDAYKQERWTEARKLFLELNSFPPARVMLERCELAEREGKPENLNRGVWRFDTK